MSLKLYVGCMFSGKSTELLRKLTICAQLNLNVLYINHSSDKRNTDHIVSTHHPFLTPSKPSMSMSNMTFLSKESLKNLKYDDYDVIGIDEFQFFGEGAVEFVLQHVEKLKKKVFVASLDSDSERNKFGHIEELYRYADSIKKCKSYCDECGPKLVPAIFSYRKVISKDISNNQIVVGAKDKYKALCRQCWLDKH